MRKAKQSVFGYVSLIRNILLMPSPSFKDPSTLFYQSSTVKRSVITSYWIVILFSIPLWWYTTSIQRLTLPRSRIYFHAQRQLRVPVDFCVEDNNVAHTIQSIFEKRIVDNPGYLGDVGFRFHARADCRQYSNTTCTIIADGNQLELLFIV